ncbi:MAG TPA: hypothetical protein VMV53_03340 [Acidimicrobiales bacterium]|nr:hypothetical protein [Acidimicrobiales bacterium]
MQLRRTVLLTVLLLVGVLASASASHADTTTTSSTTSTTTTTTTPGTTTTTPSVSNPSRAPGLPLFQFVNSGAGVLPWNAVSFESAINNTTMLGGPHAAANAAEGVLAYRTTQSHIATYTQGLTGAGQWTDLSPYIDAQAPASDPIPFFDPWGNVDVLYVSATGDLELLSANDPVSALWLHTHHDIAWRPRVSTDLSAITGVTAATGTGLASIQVTGQNATLAVRTAKNTIAVFTLQWDLNQPIPYLSAPPVDVSKLTHTGTAIADPVVLATPLPAVVTTTAAGHLELYTETAVGSGAWVAQDLTRATSSPRLSSGPLASAATTYSVYVGALGANGNVELFASPIADFPAGATTTTTTTTTTSSTTSTSTSTTAPPTTTIAPTPTTIPPLTPSFWTALNVTATTAGAPPLSGAIYLSATDQQITIAGAAANWGDLFALTSANGITSWTATDVSVTAGSAARTVAGVVTGLQLGPTLNLFAAGIGAPPPQGVGVYAIPSAKWTKAVSDGWPILSETGGLGTTSSPWVGFTSATSVATSPDFLMGQSIYNAHKRVTWLSFWTVSGPMKKEPQTAATYYGHGFAAGAWVASQIDQYRALGVGLKPDWVIFDPEGYPDNHSALDAPAGASNATIALYGTYWSAMLQGWAQGITSVDPSLNAGVYASQSEYRNYKLASQPLPVFMAVAFGYGGPVPVAGASGANVRGFIAFNAVCTPATTLLNQEQTLLNPPWGGQFNTLQFNAGVYCPPSPT